MKKHILLVLSGMSPAVITETVYALKEAKRLPNKVVAITTSTGKTEIIDKLLTKGNDGKSVWDQLVTDIKGEGKIEFGSGAAYIKLIPGENHADAEDIKSEKDNERMADFLLSSLREYTENPDYEVSFSIAGGRKTMSAVGALVMTLLGRKEDKLYHVLVNAPYDNPRLEPRFYYPKSGQVYLNAGAQVEEAPKLELAELPFVRARYWFQEKIKQLPGEYMGMVDEINCLNQSDWILDVKAKKLHIGNKVIKFSAVECALYWMLAERAKEGKGNITTKQGNEELKTFYESKKHFFEREIRTNKIREITKVCADISKKIDDANVENLNIKLKLRNDRGEYQMKQETADKITIKTLEGDDNE